MDYSSEDVDTYADNIFIDLDAVDAVNLYSSDFNTSYNSKPSELSNPTVRVTKDPSGSYPSVNGSDEFIYINCTGFMVPYPASTPVILEADYNSIKKIFKFYYIAADFCDHADSKDFLTKYFKIGTKTADSLYKKIDYLIPFAYNQSYNTHDIHGSTSTEYIGTNTDPLNSLKFLNKAEKAAAEKLRTFLELELLYNELVNIGVGYSLVRRLYFEQRDETPDDTADKSPDKTPDKTPNETADETVNESADKTSIRGLDTLNYILSNPYILLKGNESIKNLAQCDDFVHKSGTGLKHRTNAVIHCFITESRNNGNSRLELRKLITKIKNFDKKKSNFLTDAEDLVKALFLGDYIVDYNSNSNTSYVWLKEDYFAEKSIVNDLERLNVPTLPDFDDNCEDKNAIQFDQLNNIVETSSHLVLDYLANFQFLTITDIEKHFSSGGRDFRFSEDQKRILGCILQYRGVKIITGPPGSGKSTLVKGLIYRYEMERGSDIALCAPTGAAAVRLSEVTGREAVTVHRLLNINAFVDYDTKIDTLDYGLIIVDESSMLDLHISKKLFSAAKDNSIVILIGDKDQLPPVGVGNVFEDLINSKKLEIYELHNIHRQAEKSGIIRNSRSIIDGDTDNIKAFDDFRFITIKNDRETEKTIGGIADFYYPRKENIKIFSPVRKTKYATSIINLNNFMASKYKTLMGLESSRSISFDYYEFFEGEPIIFTYNNYDNGYFNGQDGIIKSIEHDEAGQYRILVSVQTSIKTSGTVSGKTISSIIATKSNISDGTDASENMPGTSNKIDGLAAFNIGSTKPSAESKCIPKSSILGKDISRDPAVDLSDTNGVDKTYEMDDTAESTEEVSVTKTTGSSAGETILELSLDDLVNIEPAFVVTAHKAQGTECDTAVVIVPKKPENMLQRRLLYTEVTRAKKRAIIISEEEAFMTAVRSPYSSMRNTGLVEKLCGLDYGIILQEEDKILEEVKKYM